MRISFDEMQDTIKRAFILAGLEETKSDTCARIHTESSCDGVYSHGLNRVKRFVEYLKNGNVNKNGEPELIRSMGAIENYDGNMGPGILNARFAMDRAIELSSDTGMGLVTLKNTTHWMRGGSYGWQAAEKGYAAICWTNTESCMPAWGAKECCAGNNPYVMAVPYKNAPVVLDMAMTLYSYGKLEVTRLAGKKLPFPGGFDENDNLTDDPGVIEKTKRILPMGYWKGSGFATLLNITAALLSGGLATKGIDDAGFGSCGSCSQVFMAFSPDAIGGEDFTEKIVSELAEQYHSAEPEVEGGKITYPGERTITTRQQNLIDGIPVDEKVWENVRELAGLL